MEMISEEKFFELVKQCQETIEQSKKLSEALMRSIELRNQQTQRLNEANTTIVALLAFIKSNNLNVPDGVPDLPPLLN